MFHYILLVFRCVFPFSYPSVRFLFVNLFVPFYFEFNFSYRFSSLCCSYVSFYLIYIHLFCLRYFFLSHIFLSLIIVFVPFHVLVALLNMCVNHLQAFLCEGFTFCRAVGNIQLVSTRAKNSAVAFVRRNYKYSLIKACATIVRCFFVLEVQCDVFLVVIITANVFLHVFTLDVSRGV